MTKNELMTENTILANNYNIVHDALDKMNETINELHNKLEAQDKIINTQALEIARLKEDKKKAREFIKKHSNCSGYFEDGKMIIDNIESIYGGYELLEILGDKE